LAAKKSGQIKERLNKSKSTAENHAKWMFHSKLQKHHIAKAEHHFKQANKWKKTL
jgi:hypothetical protein